MENIAPLPSRQHELKETLGPYRKLWFLWVQSSSCFLTDEEIRCVISYYRSGSYADSAAELHLSHIILYMTIKNVIAKLNLFLPLFEKWQALREELDVLLKIQYEDSWQLE